MAFDDLGSNVLFFLRWIHIFSGIVWIGLLYFFNFVNIPVQGALAADLKPKVNPHVLGRALFWFRWGAMSTFVIGLLLFLSKYFMYGAVFYEGEMVSDRAMWIMLGMTFGTIMWFNVWFIIWPAQKKLLGGMKSGNPPADGPQLAKRAGLASRINTYFSAPMLFCMIAPNNYPSINAVSVLVVIVVGFLVIKGLYKISTCVGTEFV